MTNALRSNIQQLASTFAAAVVTALRAANLQDILALAADAPAAAAPAARAPAPSAPKARPKPPVRRKTAAPAAAAPAAAAPAPASAATRKAAKGRLRRRSPADIAQALQQVVSLVKSNKAGMRAEQIRAALKMEAKEMPRILKDGLAKKLLKSKGQKRSTTYSVG